MPMTMQDGPQIEGIDIRSVVALLRRQVWLIAITTAVVVALAVAYLVVAKPVYTASTLVFVDTKARSLVYDDQGVAPSNDNARVESEVEILRSATVALAVVRDQNLVTDPEFGPRISLRQKLLRALGFDVAQTDSGPALVKSVLGRFMDAVTVRRRGLTYLISVDVESESPDRAAELSNALAAAYISAQLESKVSGALGARDKLEGQIAAASQTLTQAEAAIDSFIDSNMARIESESGRADIAALRAELDRAEADRLAAEVRAQAGRAALATQDWERLVADLGDQALAELQRQRADLETRLAGVAAGSTEETDLRAELAALDREQRDRADAALGLIDGQRAGLQQSAEDLRARLRETLLAGNIPSAVLTDLYGLQQEASIARSQYQLLLSRMRELEVQAAVQLADSRVVSPALPPLSPSYPNSKMALVLALAAGLGLGVGLAFLNEYYIGGITAENQLAEVARARVASAIPLINIDPDKERSPADRVVTEPLSAYSESIRRLRASIELSPRRGASEDGARAQVVVLTSTIPAEGKSSTALALARAFAQANRHVLLIDADLRKPSIARQVGLTPTHGLIDWLNNPGNERLGNAFIAKDPLTSLSLALGAGRALSETDQLLGGAAFAEFLQMARATFDIVIIDTPPLLPVVDTRYLAGYGDLVLMVVRFGVTGQGDLRSALSVLRESMRPDAELRAVLSHQPASAKPYRYRGYYADADEA